jgi:hypothetical protein
LWKNAAEVWHIGPAMLLMYAENIPRSLHPRVEKHGVEAKQKAWQPLLRQLAQTMELSYLLQEYKLVRVRTGLDSRRRAG